ncbi:bifunctional metallophosphatase/5'-nucleotidase [Methanogenium marinum]|uniref:Bifunctional metallophosphatase/5'-nucleotidase n=1 Tax=Methanogenium marinum TaxID=348610 RepID=A0A9Q4KV66_9EURY|nr:bifunctional UDP-sugar hydrolase/5'-nucleotidase [Methanogenium marinum]MDE4908797.1 bifunctional metallophosphatase/5'-nucleotidase [Methanogenium marinum]
MQRSSVIWYIQAIILSCVVIAILLLAILSTGIGSGILGGMHTGNSTDLGEQNDSPYSGTIRILTTPDIHSHLFGMSDTDTGTRIGRIGALAETLGEEKDTTLYLFAGDLGEGSFYHTYAGIPEVTAYSMAGFDVAVPGNHAFDFSTGLFEEWATNASYPVICANLDFADTGLNDTVKDYIILDAGGAKVGIFGIITPQLEKIVPLGEDVILYDNTAEIGNSAVTSLKEEGADIIIALTHQDRDEDISLAQSVPGIDLIIGGHDHLVWNETVTAGDGTDTLIVHAGKYGEETDTVDITMFNGVVIGTAIERYEITEDMPDDEEITSFVTPYYEKYTESLSEGIGSTTVPLDVQKKTLRTGETNAGDFTMDTVRENVPGVDIALINSGTIRGDCIIPAGEISYLTLNEMFPYENLIVTVQMTGSEIKETLERSASALVVTGDGCPGENRAPSGGFLQVSGVRFTINTKAETFCIDYDTNTVNSAGERIEDLSVVTESGDVVPIGMDTTYTVAVNDYIAGGGDGYTNLEAISDERKFATEINLIDLVAGDIEENSPISPETDGRILVLW